MLVITALIAAILAMHVNNAYRAAAQRNALTQLWAQKGVHDTFYEWRIDESFESVDLPGWPAWLVDMLGPDYFYGISTFGLEDCIEPDSLIDQASSLGQLRRVYLTACTISPGTAKNLTSLEQLEWLSCAYSKLDGRALTELSKMTHLRILDLRGTQVTDASTDDLARLINLEYLYLGQTTFSNDAIQELRQILPRCKVLRKHNTWPALSAKNGK
jgi:hypothetical protein